MKDFRYIDNVATLTCNKDKCVGCGLCVTICPHRIFGFENGKAVIKDLDACMECGACALNCPTRAISVTPGVGCASLIIQRWLPFKKTSCC